MLKPQKSRLHFLVLFFLCFNLFSCRADVVVECDGELDRNDVTGKCIKDETNASKAEADTSNDETNVSKDETDNSEIMVECDGGELSRCLGQTIKVSGFLANTGNDEVGIMQHPLMTGPESEHQTYLKFNEQYGQIVLVSKSPITCSGKVNLSGRLERVSLECQPGQKGKCPYSGYFVYVQDFSCSS